MMIPITSLTYMTAWKVPDLLWYSPECLQVMSTFC
jgi:hypothetical protein